ncbi:hypothetical protein M9Y10_039367 [Tritrichomonas musculus]|uniref:SPIN90/Ldb17 leucine-rich domain-containing protein n=2 Tax=Tritrichomonas musculus TaxID=1915356 RepID=A0ABR2KBN3_9EUKA
MYQYKPEAISENTTKDIYLMTENSETDFTSNKIMIFDLAYFLNLKDDMAIEFYLLNYKKLKPIDEKEFNSICIKILNTENDPEKILLMLLKFISRNKFIENIDFAPVYNFIVSRSVISDILINIIIQFIIISKKVDPYDHFIQNLINEGNFIYKDCFWILCFFFRKYENKISNRLPDVGILEVIKKLLTSYEQKSVSLSTIELMFKVFLMIITSNNIQFIRKLSWHLLDYIVYFKDDFIESLLITILLDENSLDFNDELFC